jgi:hypothetical protein
VERRYSGCNVEEIVHAADKALYAAKGRAAIVSALAHPPAELKIDDTVTETQAST